MNRAGKWLWVALLSAAASWLYFQRLGSSTPYLSIEEVFQARDAVVLSTTGRNLSGELLPIYSPDPGAPLGREPIWVYLGATLLRFLPFSEALIRAPSAFSGVLNVVLMFIIVQEIFGSTTLAAVAAAMLMLTPAHF